MTLTRTQTIAYGIIAALAAVFLGLLIFLQLTKATPASAPPRAAPVGGLTPETAAAAFDVQVLSDPRYQSLDASLFDAGRLPVPVPASRGKPNLF